MLPFNNTVMNNYMGEMYSSVNNMVTPFFCVPTEWAGFGNVAPQPEPILGNPCILLPMEDKYKREAPTLANTRPSKPKPTKKEDPEVFVWSGE